TSLPNDCTERGYAKLLATEGTQLQEVYHLGDDLGSGHEGPSPRRDFESPCSRLMALSWPALGWAHESTSGSPCGAPASNSKAQPHANQVRHRDRSPPLARRVQLDDEPQRATPRHLHQRQRHHAAES